MSSSYTSVSCTVNQDNQSNNGLPGDNEFFVLRERDNAEILRRVFVVANPEVYNIGRPQNTQLVHKNDINGRLLKYPGIDRRSRNYWSQYLNQRKNDGLPTNFDIGYTKEGENSNENDFMPHVAGINKNIINENSLKGLGRLNKLDATRRPELVGLEKVMGSMDMYDTYFSVSNNLDNARLFFGNSTRAASSTL